MFIENVPTNLYISSVEELLSCLDMDLYRVGQGGICSIQDPYNMGTLHYVDQVNQCLHIVGKSQYYSLRDSHVIPQTYNNWYICDSEEKAKKLTEFLKNTWNSDPKFEAAREDYKEWCKRWDDYDCYGSAYD